MFGKLLSAVQSPYNRWILWGKASLMSPRADHLKHQDQSLHQQEVSQLPVMKGVYAAPLERSQRSEDWLVMMSNACYSIADCWPCSVLVGRI